MIKRCFFSAIVIVSLLFIQMQGNEIVASEHEKDGKKVERAIEHMTDLEKTIREIALHYLHVGDPSKAEQLRSYAMKNNVSIDEITNILMRYISDGLKVPLDNWEKASQDMLEEIHLCGFAIGALGELRSNEALPLLIEIALTDKNNLDTDRAINRRRSAVRSIVKIGGQGLIDFAQQVLEDSRYVNLDRHALYEELSKYVKEDASLGNEELRNSVKQFLLSAINQEPHAGNVMRLDKLLSNINSDYRTSYQRENILKKFKVSNVAKHRKYFSEKLKELQEIPATKRTNIDIKEN